MKKHKVEEQIFKHYRKKICSFYMHSKRKNEPFTAIYMVYGSIDGEDKAVNYRVHKGQSLRPISTEKVKKSGDNPALNRRRRRKIGKVSVIIDHQRKVIKHDYAFGPTWGMGTEVPFRVEKNRVVIKHEKAKMIWVS